MSAYAALKALKYPSSLQSGSNNESDADDDDVLSYQPNSSDDDDVYQDNNNMSNNKNNYNSNNNSNTIINNFSQNTPPIKSTDFNLVFLSNFTPNNENLIVENDFILIGLKSHESILINGQCKFSIERGASLVNNIHYISSTDVNNLHTLIASTSQSLPIISSTDIINSKTPSSSNVSDKFQSFPSHYINIIKIQNLFTGLEKVGDYHSPFKSFFHNSNSDNNFDEYYDSESDKFSKFFEKFSFQIVYNNNTSLSGINVQSSWLNGINSLISDIYQPKIFIIIGKKNSGKSTFSKILLNSLILKENHDCSYLDLDPGQSEFSNPYTLSITNVSKPIFGLNIPSTLNNEDVYSHYYGYTSPQQEPNHYLTIIKRLFEHYKSNNESKRNHLVINTPGWIKGFGKELLNDITDLIKPDNLVYLTNDQDDDDLIETSEILDSLTFNEVLKLPGIHKSSKYSPAQLRMFNKLRYFHESGKLLYNFNDHLLKKSPLRLSYQTSDSDSDFKGINAMTVFNYDTKFNFNIDDIFLMLEASIVGVYMINPTLYTKLSPLITKPKRGSDLPMYLDSTKLTNLFQNDSTFQFIGLSIIHSININNHYFNLYFPTSNSIHLRIKSLLEQDFKLILVKGEGDIPSCEMFLPELINQQQISRKRLLDGDDSEIDQISELPYISFENKSKVGGVWRSRRNVMRKNQQR